MTRFTGAAADRVLILDSDAALCRVLALVLPRAGFVVQTADAAGALGAIGRGGSIDVLVVTAV